MVHFIWRGTDSKNPTNDKKIVRFQTLRLVENIDCQGFKQGGAKKMGCEREIKI